MGDYALIARDAESIYAAISTCSSNEPKTASAAFKTPESEAWASALAAEVGAHYKEKTLGPALTTLPPGTTAIPIEAIFRTKRDGRKKARTCHHKRFSHDCWPRLQRHVRASAQHHYL